MQPQRRELETVILRQYFSPDAFVWQTKGKHEWLDIGIKTQSDAVYRLNVMIPSDYPNSCPALWVVYPNPLRFRSGVILDGPSHDMHTLERTSSGLRICHYEPGEWSPNHTLYRVVLKGRLWLECYEAHLRTGKTIDELSGGMWL